MTDVEWQELLSDAGAGWLPGIRVWHGLTEDERETLLAIADGCGGSDIPTDCYDRVERLCVMCQHWHFEFAGRQSVLDGAWLGPVTQCGKKIWEIGASSGGDVWQDEYVQCLLTARACDDFSPSRVAIENLPEDG